MSLGFVTALSMKTDLPPLQPDIVKVIIDLPIAAKACEEGPVRHIVRKRGKQTRALLYSFTTLLKPVDL